jgi:hypothetical protein
MPLKAAARQQDFPYRSSEIKAKNQTDNSKRKTLNLALSFCTFTFTF